jgi:hypothetical protein
MHLPLLMRRMRDRRLVVCMVRLGGNQDVAVDLIAPNVPAIGFAARE